MTEYNIDWENVPFVEDVNAIFTAGHLAKYGTDLKCKMFRSDEHQKVFFAFYINEKAIAAALTYEAYDNVENISIVKDLEYYIMLALDGKTYNINIGKK